MQLFSTVNKQGACGCVLYLVMALLLTAERTFKRCLSVSFNSSGKFNQASSFYINIKRVQYTIQEYCNLQMFICPSIMQSDLADFSMQRLHRAPDISILGRVH